MAKTLQFEDNPRTPGRIKEGVGNLAIKKNKMKLSKMASMMNRAFTCTTTVVSWIQMATFLTNGATTNSVATMTTAMFITRRHTKNHIKKSHHQCIEILIGKMCAIITKTLPPIHRIKIRTTSKKYRDIRTQFLRTKVKAMRMTCRLAAAVNIRAIINADQISVRTLLQLKNDHIDNSSTIIRMTNKKVPV